MAIGPTAFIVSASCSCAERPQLCLFLLVWRPQGSMLELKHSNTWYGWKVPFFFCIGKYVTVRIALYVWHKRWSNLSNGRVLDQVIFISLYLTSWDYIQSFDLVKSTPDGFWRNLIWHSISGYTHSSEHRSPYVVIHKDCPSLVQCFAFYQEKYFRQISNPKEAISLPTWSQWAAWISVANHTLTFNPYLGKVSQVFVE